MSPSLYLKTRVWDALLCVVASCALVYTVSSAFYAMRPFQELPVAMFALCAAVTLVLFVIAFSYQTAVPGSIAFAVAVVIALVVCARLSTAEHVMDDVEGNYLIFTLVLVVCTVLVFVLSRRKVTTLILLGAGLLICVAVEYLYWRGHLLSLVLFGVSVAALFAYRTYQQSVLSAKSDKLAFGSVVAAGAGTTLAALLVSALIFMLVIAPLQPSNLVVKLLTEHKRVDQVDVRGTGDAVDVQNLELFSINTNGQIQKGLTNDQTQDSEENTDPTVTTSNDTENNAGSALALDDESEEESVHVISLDLPPWAFVVGPIALILLLLIPFVIKKRLRSNAYNRMLQGDPSDAIKALYPFFVQRFDRFGVALPAGATVGDYSRNFATTFSQFESASQVPTFGELTSVFEQTAYGGAKATEQERSLFEEYYKFFYKNARKFVGSLRYLRLFFFI